MTKFRGLKRFGLALGLALALTAQSSYAGSIFIDLTVDDGINNSNFQIFNGSGFEVGSSTDNNVSADVGLLNLLLAANGLGHVTLTTIGANSNNPGSTNALLTQSNSAQLLAGSGNVTITALVYQTDFTLPIGNGTLFSSATSNFASTAAGDSQSFQSWFDQGNTGAMSTPSPVVNFVFPDLANNNSGVPSDPNASPTGLGVVSAPFALVNQVEVSITAAAGQSATASFGGSTTLIANPIPEPASVVMMMSAFPIAFGLLRRHRRGTK